MSPGRWGPFGSGVVIGLVCGLLVAVLVGILTGKLFDDSSDDPVAQAREVIEGHYFHDPDPQALDDASIAGMVAEVKKRYDDKFSHYFTAEQLKQFEAVDLGPLQGDRARGDRGPEGAARSPTSSRTRPPRTPG